VTAILMYHYLGQAPDPSGPHRSLWVPPDEFRWQLGFLRRAGFRAVGPQGALESLSSPGPDRRVWITFDDGFRDNFETGLPLLREAGMTATFFLVADWTLGGDPRCMDPGMVRELVAEGMTIGSHTVTHPELTGIPPDQARKEIVDSRKRLEDAFGVAVESFAYPRGKHDAATMEMVREAGYGLAASTLRGNRNGPGDRWRLKRVMVQPGRTGWRFRYALGPVYHALHSRKNRRKQYDDR